MQAHSTTTTRPLPEAHWRTANHPDECSVCGHTIRKGRQYLTVPEQYLILCSKCADAPAVDKAADLCPECGKPTEAGNCFNVFCTLGLQFVQVELGRDTPEDWLMIECEEPACAGSLSRVLVGVAA